MVRGWGGGGAGVQWEGGGAWVQWEGGWGRGPVGRGWGRGPVGGTGVQWKGAGVGVLVGQSSSGSIMKGWGEINEEERAGENAGERREGVLLTHHLAPTSLFLISSQFPVVHPSRSWLVAVRPPTALGPSGCGLIGRWEWHILYSPDDVGRWDLSLLDQRQLLNSILLVKPGKGSIH